MNIQKNDLKNRQTINPMAAVVTGAVVGAGVGVAGTIILKDKKNREKVKQTFTNVRDKTMEYLEDLRSTKDTKIVKEPKEDD